MRRESRKYLHDLRRAVEVLADFTSDKTIGDYAVDALLRSAVERQFEIIGEALKQLARIDPDAVAEISDHSRIVAFRNLLIHGYADVDDRIVWGVLTRDLSVLRREVESWLAEAGAGT